MPTIFSRIDAYDFVLAAHGHATIYSALLSSTTPPRVCPQRCFTQDGVFDIMSNILDFPGDLFAPLSDADADFGDVACGCKKSKMVMVLLRMVHVVNSVNMQELS